MSTIARRFIIICLVFVIFALLMAAAVANSDRHRNGWNHRAIGACFYFPNLNCSASR